MIGGGTVGGNISGDIRGTCVASERARATRMLLEPIENRRHFGGLRQGERLTAVICTGNEVPHHVGPRPGSPSDAAVEPFARGLREMMKRILVAHEKVHRRRARRTWIRCGREPAAVHAQRGVPR